MRRALNIYRGGSTPPPTSLIQSWYDSLSVKPSEGLWTDLNNLANTLNDAGKWTEFDFFALIAGMETDEQRLTPLITTSGNTMTAVNSPTINSNGVTGNGTNSYLNFNWSPDNVVKYTLNDACIGVYSGNSVSASGRAYMGIAVAGSGSMQLLSGTTNYSGFINGSTITSTLSVVGSGLRSLRRINSNTVRFKLNGIDGVNQSNNSSFIPPTSFTVLGCCRRTVSSGGVSDLGPAAFSTDTIRCFFIGSSALQNDDVLYNALTTFFAARGLTTF